MAAEQIETRVATDGRDTPELEVVAAKRREMALDGWTYSHQKRVITPDGGQVEWAIDLCFWRKVDEVGPPSDVNRSDLEAAAAERPQDWTRA